MHGERDPRKRRQHGPPEEAQGTRDTLRALERLARRPYSTPELAASLHVGVRTARLLLQRLEKDGYAVQGGGRNKRYRATLRVVALGQQTMKASPLGRLATRRVRELASATSRPAHLWVPSASGVESILRVSPPQGPQQRTHIAVDDDVFEHLSETRAIHVRVSGSGVVMGAVGLCGTVVAALGITDAPATGALTHVAAAADALTEDVAQFLATPR